MTSSLLPLVGLLLLMALLPWVIQRLRQRSAAGQLASASAMKIVSAMAVGPNQKLLTVEVGPQGARAWLVLGVSAQAVTCLHRMDIPMDIEPKLDLPVERLQDRPV
jgi:flagellar protein FliO/FliZ